MSRKNKSILLLAAALLLLLGIGMIRRLSGIEDRKTVKQTLFVMEPSDIVGLSWEYNGIRFDFQREGNGTWKFANEPDFLPVSENLEVIAVNICSMLPHKTIEEPAELSEYGLDDPCVAVHITTVSGAEELTFGNAIRDGQERYCSIGDGKVYLVSAVMGDVFLTTKEALAESADSGSSE